MKFSISNGCFYDPSIHEDIPADAVDVTIKEFKDLSAGRNSGKRIVLGKGGKLQLADAEKVVLSREEVAAQRLNAYANVITGSDRYFAEAQRMQVMGEPDWEEVRAEGVRRFEAIQEMFPWPDQD